MKIKPAVLLLVLTSVLFAGQGQSNANHPADGAPNASSINLSFEPVGPGDLIDVYVADYHDVTRSYRISIAGTIELPVRKMIINVDHMTCGEIQKAIAKSLVDAHLLVDPVVSVAVLEYRSKPVNVVGAVHEPLTLQAIGGVRLLDAISRAGGLAPEAGPEIIVSRPALNGETAYARHVSVKELMGNAESGSNISLYGGEEIRVPVADKLYIAGNVRNPGAYAMDAAGALTVLQALALCQGTLPFSRPMAVVYRLRPGSSIRYEVAIPLKEIMKRRADDVALLPNDIFYIPDASGKRMSATVMDRIASFGGATTSGLIIYGNR